MTSPRWPGHGPSRRSPACCGPAPWHRTPRARWLATPAALAAGLGGQAALPAGTLPLERLQVIVPALAATDPLRLQPGPAPR